MARRPLVLTMPAVCSPSTRSQQSAALRAPWLSVTLESLHAMRGGGMGALPPGIRLN